MKKAIYHLFGELTYEEKQEKIDERLSDTYNKYKDQDLTRKEIELKFDNESTDDEKKYRKNKDLEKHYSEKRRDYIDQYIDAKDEKAKKEKEKKEEKEKVQYIYRPYESAESKEIRRQKAIEEQNRMEASNELPGVLEKINTEFSEKLDEKVSKISEKIQKEINNYPLESLKIFIEDLIKIEKLIDKLIEDSKKLSEKILNKSFNSPSHFNVLLIGKTGVGKSTLINGIFDFNENEGAKTGFGKSITQKFDEFMSDKRKGLKIIDSKGIEMGEFNINSVFNLSKELIEKKAAEGKLDNLIHCIWYCFKSSNDRFEPIEKEIVTLLMDQYNDNNLPIIMVITQNYDDEATQNMIEYIKNEFKFLNREINIMPVIAKEKKVMKKNKEITYEKEGIEELIQISFEKSQKAIYPAIKKSIEQQITQMFEVNIVNNKNKLKDEIKEIIQKSLNEIIEDEKLENNISNFSLIIEKTLNVFFEIAHISEKSKNDINKFLVDICNWCIEKLNDIISNLLKENSNELGLLLLKEQVKVKNNHNCQLTLYNEKTADQYIEESENFLKPFIINKVYFLSLKYIYNIISEKIVHVSEEVMNEQFNSIIPEIRNNISDEKLKQLSNKILQDIIKNQ